MHAVDGGDRTARPDAPAAASLGETRERFSIKVPPAAARPTPRFCSTSNTAAALQVAAPEREGSAPARATPVSIDACALLQRVQWGLYCSSVHKQRAIVASACRSARMARARPDSDAAGARASGGDAGKGHRQRTSQRRARVSMANAQHGQRGDVPVFTLIASGALAARLFPSTTPLSTSSPTRRLLDPARGFDPDTMFHAALVTVSCVLVLSLSLWNRLLLPSRRCSKLRLRSQWGMLAAVFIAGLLVPGPAGIGVHGQKVRAWRAVGSNPRLEDGPPPKYGQAMAVADNFLFTFGGETNTGENYFIHACLTWD